MILFNLFSIYFPSCYEKAFIKYETWALKFQTDTQLQFNHPEKEQNSAVVMDMTTSVASNIGRNKTNSEKQECKKPKTEIPAPTDVEG